MQNLLTASVAQAARLGKGAGQPHFMLRCILLPFVAGASREGADSVVEKLLRGGHMDRAAVMLSGLCLVHCIVTIVALGLISSAAAWLGNPIIHEVGLGLATALGAMALVGGAVTHGALWPTAIGGVGLALMTAALMLPHGGAEAYLTIAGVTLLAVAHIVNRRVHAQANMG
jgi:MerC mercury resistance protein